MNAKDLNRVQRTLFIIDPQNDFLGNSDGTPYETTTRGKDERAALPVKGAVDDMERLAGFIERDGDDGIDDIIVTLDTHELHDIGHAPFWRARDGRNPSAFTPITVDDVKGEVYMPADHALYERVLRYMEAVGSQMVWPTHCIERTWGHGVYAPLEFALARWELRTRHKVQYIYKGMNPLTEQYGAFYAAVPQDDDLTTHYHWPLLERLQRASQRIYVAGEALDFCVKTTVEQLLEKLSPGDARKLEILVDCMSSVNVDGKNTAAKAFMGDLNRRGITRRTSAKLPKTAAAS